MMAEAGGAAHQANQGAQQPTDQQRRYAAALVNVMEEDAANEGAGDEVIEENI